ncbi:hypothetical protein LMH87_005086 [Akanthomyces muscarius]|uniref:Gfd2/YDR514C-like C-terminal domain-containing protein n=1 Tax=Akanthomyces muscarius TaxID=2231603 RepID=A0A9W8QK09_AKAMU|nr:hypothetical protein LMH87_005086 [Akanthomyces muscarius]KAJ4163351.1 hypothetical protein LMH87_005086 [Akanthomyces muscarius]
MFRWRHWEELWQNNLFDLKATKEIAGTTAFVAMDTEPWSDQVGHNPDAREACEIGIALLLPLACHSKPTSEPPRTLEEIHQRFNISSHCIRIRGREHADRGERFWGGGNERVTYAEHDGVEDALINILHTGQQHYYSSDSTPLTLTLVGFDLCAEFRILSHQYPRFLKRFTSWVDIQELVKELTPLNTQAPSLRNTLIGVGYEPKFPTKPSRSGGHSAGNDAARSIAVLVTLLFFFPRGEDITQACLDYHANRTKQRANRQRENVNMNKRDLFSKHYPKPRERYPFQAKVDLPGACITKWQDPAELCQYFLEYKPVAAGTNSTQVFGGWICWPSLKELELFLKVVDGLEDAEGRGTWVAKSRYDPKVVSAFTKTELDEYLRLKSASEIAAKKKTPAEA